MITYVTGDILASEADYLVCPVNCVGTMGKGLALQFKRRFPALDAEYQKTLRDGRLAITRPAPVVADGRKILLFPTKWHWKEPSRYEWIGGGLRNFYYHYDLFYGHGWSFAFPRLGAGLGGLTWEAPEGKPSVKKSMEFWLSRVNGEMFIYEPSTTLHTGRTR